MSKLFYRIKGQTTIFIILAIFIVAVTAIFVVYRTSESISVVPPSLEAPYNSLLSCIEEESFFGIKIMETQGGYIDLPEFEPGSFYMPFSSQLDFLGNPIPYWYYVSGSGVQKEQVPSEPVMQRELSRFVEERVKDCDFGSYLDEGFEIEKGDPRVNTVIRNNEVEVDVSMDFSIGKGLDRAYVKNHNVVVKSSLGSLYNDAKKIYDKEQKELFLEERGVDILRLYAPVDGVEITCSPLIWDADKVFDDLKIAIEANTYALKPKGDSNDYFVLDLDTSHNVRFLNSRNWSFSFEVAPSQGKLLMANPVGNQPGLGILGFCYVTYHFVYDIKYPVVIQVQEGDEIFQFPIAIVIQGNLPREPLSASAVGLEIPDFCKYKNTKQIVNVYDIRENPVEAEISYQCAGTTCYIGKTQDGVLDEYFPQCVNGRIIARSEGYREAREIYSTTKSGEMGIFLDKVYDLSVLLKVDGRLYNKQAIISFVSNESSSSIVYPEQKNISLSDGEYDVEVYIYENSSLKIGGDTMEQCYQVPNGVLGFFGFKKEKCIEIETPEQLVSQALAGGGRQKYYVLASDLEKLKVIEINAESLPVPGSLEQLQDNYILFEDRGLEVDFK